jgi:hypothetical protein
MVLLVSYLVSLLSWKMLFVRQAKFLESTRFYSKDISNGKGNSSKFDKIHFFILTPNTPLIHTSFTYSKLNMDNFSTLTGLLGYLDSTQEVELKSLHAETMSFLLLNLYF